MDLDDLRKLLAESTRSAFRLETLPQYLVPQEEEQFAAWRAGKPLKPRTIESLPWMAAMAERVAKGYRQYRVHILDHPLSDYTRFELHGYVENQAAGEEIHIADRHEHPELEELHEDFWLYDDEIAIRMIYDEEGHFLYPERVDDPAQYRHIRDVALRCAEPLDDYLRRRRPELANE